VKLAGALRSMVCGGFVLVAWMLEREGEEGKLTTYEKSATSASPIFVHCQASLCKRPKHRHETMDYVMAIYP
jgi:hypothetical protein